MTLVDNDLYSQTDGPKDTAGDDPRISFEHIDADQVLENELRLDHHLEWLEKLTPQQQKLYREIAYLLPLFRTILIRNDFLALPEESTDNKYFLWSDLTGIMDTIIKRIKEFFGKPLAQLVEKRDLVMRTEGAKEMQTLLGVIEGMKASLVGVGNLENTEKRQTFKPLAETFAIRFPKAHAPLMSSYHGKDIAQRADIYPKIIRILSKIEDPKHRELAEKTVSQIGVILRFLDFIWSLHEVIDDGGSKRIIYPEKMLLPLNLLMKGNHKFSDAFSKLWPLESEPPAAPPDSFISPEFFYDLRAITLSDESQPGIRLDLVEQYYNANSADISACVGERANAQIDQAIGAAPSSPSNKNLKLRRSFGEIAFVTRNMTKGAEQSLQCIQPLRLVTEDGAYMTLSNDIQDCLSTLEYGLTETIAAIGKIFQPDLGKNEAIPDFNEYEEQAATLRIHLNKLGAGIKEIDQRLKELYANPQNANLTEARHTITIGLMELNVAISKFQSQQEQDLNHRKYHAVLRGADYEMVNQFIAALRRFFREAQLRDVNDSSVNAHMSTSGLDQFIFETYRDIEHGDLPKNGCLEKCLTLHKELKRIESGIDAAELQNGTAANLEERYRQAFGNVLRSLKEIAADKSGKNQPAQERCQSFLAKHPREMPHSADDCNKGFFRLLKLFNRLRDFDSLFDLEKDHQFDTHQALVANYHQRLARNVIEKTDFIMNEMGTADSDSKTPEAIIDAINFCRNSLEHFQALEAESIQLVRQTLEALLFILNQTRRHRQPLANEVKETFFVSLREFQSILKEAFRLST